MGGFSLWHWLIVAIVALLLFGGRGKISQLMGDAAQGIRAFQRGLKEGGDEERGTSAKEPAGALPRTEAEQEALRRAAAEQPAEPR